MAAMAGRIRSAVAAHPGRTGIVALVLVALLAASLYWFEPQALFLDDKVDEGIPQVAPGAAAGAEPDAAFEDEDEKVEGEISGEGPEPEGPTTLAEGHFRSLAHEGSGRAVLLELADGSRYLRFEDFEVENGPDLRVYLSTAPSDSPDDGVFNEDYVDLGGLKGNVGNQNYRVPGDVRLSRYESVIVWCRRFSVGFAVAPIV
jgi:hypothetical protein